MATPEEMARQEQWARLGYYGIPASMRNEILGPGPFSPATTPGTTTGIGTATAAPLTPGNLAFTPATLPPSTVAPPNIEIPPFNVTPPNTVIPPSTIPVPPDVTSLPPSTVPAPPQLTFDTLHSAADYNAKNLPQTLQMANLINQFNIQQQRNALNARVPGIEQADMNELANIESAQRFEVPDALRYTIGQEMAQRGVATGSPWGANTGAGYGTAIMKELLRREEQAGSRLAQLKASNPAASLFDISSQLMTPAQAAEVDVQLAKLANDFYATRLDDETKRALATASNRLALYGTQLDDETKRALAKVGFDVSVYGTQMDAATKRSLAQVTANLSLYSTQLDDETKKWLTLQTLAQQMQLGLLDDATKRWIAQLDADTRKQIANLSRLSAAGGSGGYRGGYTPNYGSLFGEGTTTPGETGAGTGTDYTDYPGMNYEAPLNPDIPGNNYEPPPDWELFPEWPG